MNSLRRLATDFAISGSSSGSGANSGGSCIHFGGRQHDTRQHTGKQCGVRHRCLALMRSCTFSACSRISWVIWK